MPEGYYGKDCPKGMVQIESVGVDPKLKEGNYGYRPSSSAFLEVYVDGQRFRIDVGTFERSEGKRRGIHINFPLGAVLDKHSANALDLYLPDAALHNADSAGERG